MKATYKHTRTIPFFDASAEVGLDPFKVQVLDPSGSEVAVLTMSQVTSAPNLYLSDSFTPLELGQFKLVYKYGDPLAPIFYDTLDVGTEPITDYPIGFPVDIVLDDNIVGGPSEPITAMILNGSGESISSTSFAAFTGDESITTFGVSNNDQLTFDVSPDPNGVGQQSVTFLCASAEAVGGVAGNFAGSSAGDTATYKINGGVPRLLDLSAVGGTEAEYIAALNAQLKGAYAESMGAGIIRLATDSEGSDSSIELDNFGASFAANTGLSEDFYDADGAANNVADSDAVTFLELKQLAEAAIIDGGSSRLSVTLEDDTDNLVLTATSGVAGNTSKIDLVSGTASLIETLGLTSLGTQGGNIPALGSDGVTLQALYSSHYDGYVLQDITFNTAQEIFIVWLNDGVQTYMTNHLITPAEGKEIINMYVGEINPTYPNGNPHIAATITISTHKGVQVAQGVTDIAGHLKLEVPPGEYVFTLTKPNTVFTTNNFTKEVFAKNSLPEDVILPVGTDVQSVQLITDKFLPTVTSPAAPADMCKLVATLYLMDGTPLRHASIHVLLIDGPQLYSSTAVIDTQKVFKTDSNGYVEFSLIQGLTVEINIAPLSVRRRITVPAEVGPVNVMTMISAAEDPFDVIKPNIVAAPKRTL